MTLSLLQALMIFAPWAHKSITLMMNTCLVQIEIFQYGRDDVPLVKYSKKIPLRTPCQNVIKKANTY